MFIARIKWGDPLTRKEIYNEENLYDTYTFETKDELNAFLCGVDEAMGWLDYEIIEDEDEVT